MIQIEADDLPIVVAQKLITATKPGVPPFNADMFDDEELLEIAQHLLVYLKEEVPNAKKEDKDDD